MWNTENNQLYKEFNFKDFNEAISFIREVAVIADRENHHPTIKNTYSKVEIWLSTHEAGDTVTGKDERLTKLIDEIIVSNSRDVFQDQLPTEHNSIKLFGDGGSRGNPGPSASGYVLLDMDDNVLHAAGVYLGTSTNNQAEYQSLKLGLEEAYKYGAREVAVHMDSMLVVNQMKGIYKVKNQELWPIHEAIKESAKRFEKVTYTHVPRELNKLADAEVNLTLDANS